MSSVSAAPSELVRDTARNRYLALLVLVSFLFFIAAFVMRIGIGATPFETTDSAGRPMGFNDPLSLEHHWIIVQHFRPSALLNPERAYEWLLLAMQAAGAWLLLSKSRVSVRLTRWFFAAQAAIFPLGLIFCWAPPFVLASYFMIGSSDRESHTDYPFVLSMAVGAHSAWVLSSLIILFALRGPGLGVAQVWRAFVENFRIGRRTFVNALR